MCLAGVIVIVRLSPAGEYLNCSTEYEDGRGPCQPGGVEGFDVDKRESETDGWRGHPDSQPARNISVHTCGPPLSPNRPEEPGVGRGLARE